MGPITPCKAIATVCIVTVCPIYKCQWHDRAVSWVIRRRGEEDLLVLTLVREHIGENLSVAPISNYQLVNEFSSETATTNMAAAAAMSHTGCFSKANTIYIQKWTSGIALKALMWPSSRSQGGRPGSSSKEGGGTWCLTVSWAFHTQWRLDDKWGPSCNGRECYIGIGWFS